MQTLKIYASLVLMLLMTVVFTPRPVLADVISALATPSRVNVPVSRATTVNVNWQVRSTGRVGFIVSSTQGRFLADGVLLSTNAQTLTQPLGAGGLVSFSETVRIPNGLIQEAVSRGATRITYERTFDDGTLVTRTASVMLAPVGANSVDFGVSRIELTFDDNALTRVIGRNDTLQARVKVNYLGGGLLQGAWQVADSVSLDGQPFYRTLRTVRQNIMGGRQVTFVSPDLPSTVSGLYAVRFVITEPSYQGQIPALDYAVEDNPLEASGRPTGIIDLTSPLSGAPVSDETVFSWSPFSAASTYRLEIFETDGSAPSPLVTEVTSDDLPQLRDAEAAMGTPVGGVYVLANTSSTSLKAMTLARLQSGKTYKWRVLAFNAEGVILAKSAFQYLVRN